MALISVEFIKSEIVTLKTYHSIAILIPPIEGIEGALIAVVGSVGGTLAVDSVFGVKNKYGT